MGILVVMVFFDFCLIDKFLGLIIEFFILFVFIFDYMLEGYTVSVFLRYVLFIFLTKDYLGVEVLEYLGYGFSF